VDVHWGEIHSAAIHAIPLWQIVYGDDTCCVRTVPVYTLKVNCTVRLMDMDSTARHTLMPVVESSLKKYCNVPAEPENVTGSPMIICADVRVLRINTRMVAMRVILTTFMVFPLSVE